MRKRASPAEAEIAEQLRKRTEELAEANRRRERLMSIVIHEIKGPLTIINGYAQILQRAITHGEVIDIGALNTIRDQVKRLARLMENLSDVNMIEGGHLELEKAPCDIVKLARSVVQDQQSTTQVHRLKLHAPKASIVGDWDCDRLAQALNNLISNAIKYSPQGGDVEVSIHRTNKEVAVEVLDHGIGIAPEDMPYVFEPFSRLYLKAEARGMGLGLFITRGIVETHGGRIWVESKPGVGSKFTFTLPIEEPIHPSAGNSSIVIGPRATP